MGVESLLKKFAPRLSCASQRSRIGILLGLNNCMRSMPPPWTENSILHFRIYDDTVILYRGEAPPTEELVLPGPVPDATEMEMYRCTLEPQPASIFTKLKEVASESDGTKGKMLLELLQKLATCLYSETLETRAGALAVSNCFLEDYFKDIGLNMVCHLRICDNTLILYRGEAPPREELVLSGPTEMEVHRFLMKPGMDVAAGGGLPSDKGWGETSNSEKKDMAMHAIVAAGSSLGGTLDPKKRKIEGDQTESKKAKPKEDLPCFENLQIPQLI